MHELVQVIVFIIFSINSLIDDIIAFRVRTHELALGIVVVLLIKFILGSVNWIDTVAGGAIGALALLLVYRLTKGRLGGGDVWFSAFMGCAFGFWTWDIGLMVAAFLGVVWTGILRLSGREANIRDIRIPFAPFMFVGAVAVALYRGLSSW